MRRLRTLIGPIASISDAITVMLACVSITSWAAGSLPLAMASGRVDPPYALLQRERSNPVAWDCRESISVGVNASRLTALLETEVMTELRSVVADISSETPYTLAIAGSTSIVPTHQWGRDMLGAEREFDVVVYFGEIGDTDLTLPGTAAVGGNFSIPGDGDSDLAYAGYVFIDVADLGDYRPGLGYFSRGALFTHEFLHVLGLDHTTHPDSMMTPLISRSTGSMGAGDVAGLRHLASLGCGY